MNFLLPIYYFTLYFYIALCVVNLLSLEMSLPITEPCAIAKFMEGEQSLGVVHVKKGFSFGIFLVVLLEGP